MVKEYLGDGVYADDDGFHVVLTTEDGIGVSNRIYLDPVVLQNLLRYAEHFRNGAKA